LTSSAPPSSAAAPAFRQHEYAGIGRVLRCDVFLRDQVHPVAQRRHVADLRHPEERHQQIAFVLAVQILDRRPVELREASVDAAGLAFERLANALVGLHVGARRRRDLHERHAPLPVRRAGEHTLERLETFDQPLRIVEPVDAHHELAAAERVAQHLHRLAPAVLDGRLGNRVRIHADRIGRDLHDPAVRMQHPVVARRADPAPLDVVGERALVGVGLEPRDVVRAHELTSSSCGGTTRSMSGDGNGMCRKKPIGFFTPSSRRQCANGSR
jgi:hypothetical protein